MSVLNIRIRKLIHRYLINPEVTNETTAELIQIEVERALVKALNEANINGTVAPGMLLAKMVVQKELGDD